MVPGWDVLESAQRQDPGRATHSSTSQHEVQRLPAPSGSWPSNLEEVLCNRDLHFLFGIAARIKKKPNKTSKKAGSRSAAETVIAAWYMCIFVIWNSGGWMTDDATSKKGIVFRRTRPRLPLNRHTTAPLPAPGSQHPAPRHVSDGAEPPGKTGRVLAEADPTRSSSLSVIRWPGRSTSHGGDGGGLPWRTST